MKAPVPISMWAAICRNPRSEWLMGHTIRRTRGEARKAYLDTWLPEYQNKALTHVRFARVEVAQKQCGQVQSEPS